MQLNEKQLRIFCELRKDSRKTLKEISTATNLPVSTVFEHLRRFEKKFEPRYAALLDYNKLRLIRANFIINCKDKKAVRDFLNKSRFANSVFRINNNFDFFVEAAFFDMAQFEDFYDELNRLKAKTKTYFVIETLKKEGFMEEQH